MWFLLCGVFLFLFYNHTHQIQSRDCIPPYMYAVDYYCQNVHSSAYSNCSYSVPEHMVYACVFSKKSFQRSLQYQYQKTYFNWGTISQRLLQRHPEHKTKYIPATTKDNKKSEFFHAKSISQEIVMKNT